MTKYKCEKCNQELVEEQIDKNGSPQLSGISADGSVGIRSSWNHKKCGGFIRVINQS